MYNHASQDYKCPICLGIQGVENEHTLIKSTDFVYQDKVVSALINSFFIGNNPGHVIVVPNDHFENIYDIPDEVTAQIMSVARMIAVAMKQVYACEGITTLQNNEPAGNQHAFHYHFHVFPRYSHDDLHEHLNEKQLVDPQVRKAYTDMLRRVL